MTNHQIKAGCPTHLQLRKEFCVPTNKDLGSLLFKPIKSSRQSEESICGHVVGEQKLEEPEEFWEQSHMAKNRNEALRITRNVCTESNFRKKSVT